MILTIIITLIYQYKNKAHTPPTFSTHFTLKSQKIALIKYENLMGIGGSTNQITSHTHNTHTHCRHEYTHIYTARAHTHSMNTQPAHTHSHNTHIARIHIHTTHVANIHTYSMQCVYYAWVQCIYIVRGGGRVGSGGPLGPSPILLFSIYNICK